MSLYLLYTLLAIVCQAFFAFFEMACVSFNKVRLQYYVSQSSRRALWLNYLLQRPSRLFGTTLIGITTSLVIGSEMSRQLYESLGLNPDWAPLTQVPLVVIFGELAPLFAARRHPEQAAIALVPIMIVLARILSPIIWLFDLLSMLMYKLMGKPTQMARFLSREEVRLAFEGIEEKKDEFNASVGQIFQLKTLSASQLMTPISEAQLVPSHITLAELRHNLSVHYTPFIPIYHRQHHNIVAIAYLRDLLKLDENKRILESARSPWFVTRDTSITQLLEQFRRNHNSLAVLLDPSGQACGILTLDQILAEIFGEETEVSLVESSNYIERTLSGDMSISEFNQQFSCHLPEGHGDTLSDLIIHQLGHLPVQDESIRIHDLEFTIDEPSLLGIKTLSVKSIRE